MRCVTVACALAAFGIAYVVAGAVVAAQEPAAAGPIGRDAGPELRPGEIVIKRTGTRRVGATRTAAPPAAKPTAWQLASRPVPVEEPAELGYAGAGPRRVTIGYLVRDPIETGWGPQVHCPAPFYSGSYSHCNSYGYDSYLPSYVPRYGSSCGDGLLFGSRSYFEPVAPARALPAGRLVRWR